MNVNKSLRLLLFSLIVAVLTFCICTGCNSDLKDDTDNYGAQENEAVSYVIENTKEYNQDSYSASEKNSSKLRKYSPVKSARRKDKDFYENAEDSYDDIDLRRYSLETYADLNLRVNDYINMMNNTTSMLQALKKEDDSSYLFEIVHSLEEMSLDLENEIEVDNYLPTEPRTKLEKSRKKMSNAAKSAWNRLHGETSTQRTTTTKTTISTTTTTSRQKVSTNISKADESDNNMFNSFDLIALIIFSILLISVLIFFCFLCTDVVKFNIRKNKGNKSSNGVKEKPDHSRLSDTKQINERHLELFSTETSESLDDMYNYDELDDGDRKTEQMAVQNQGTKYSFTESEETIEESLEKTLGAVCTIQYFIKRCNEIARSKDDSDTKATEVRKLIHECSGRASSVSCINEDEAYYSSRVIPIFITSKTINKFLRFDNYLIPSPTIQFDSEKDSLYTFASIEKTGYITAIEPGKLKKNEKNEYELIKKGKWTV